MFQSTHPHGVRRIYRHTRGQGRSFNLRTHTGCDRSSSIRSQSRTVSIHAPTRGATICIVKHINLQIVSIHAPTWGATLFLFYAFYLFGVSIHAPTWGATQFDITDPIGLAVSIHAPTWGATCYVVQRYVALTFQSTHPHGVRHERAHNLLPKQGGSIHAPTWGCDRLITTLRAPMASFNPRTHMGCDALVISCALLVKFQSTHPHGVRHITMLNVVNNELFQSTHPHGVRHCSA